MHTPHSEYLSLGKTKEERLENYRALFKVPVSTELLNDIRESVNKGLALGGDRFKAQIETLTNKRVAPRKAGRPQKKTDSAN